MKHLAFSLSSFAAWSRRAKILFASHLLAS
jgi:hypothetical protein